MARSMLSEEMELLRRQLAELQTLVLEPPAEAAAPAEVPSPSGQAPPASARGTPLPDGEHLVRQLMDASPDGIAVLDMNLVISRWNPAMARVFGISEEAAVGRSLIDVLPLLRSIEEDLCLFEALQGRTAVSKDRPFVVEAAGRQGYFDGHCVPVRGESGAVLGCLFIVRDVTERRLAEEARRAVEERHQAFFENPHVMVFTHDLEGNLTSLNKAGERITGYSAPEALRMKFSDFVAPDSLQTFLRLFQRQIAGDNPAASEIYILSKSGDRVALEISTRPIFRNAKPFAIQGVARDITERKKTEAALQLANQKLEAWVDELEQRTREMTLLSEMGDMLRACLNTDEAYTVIVRVAQQIFPVQAGALYVITPSRNLVEAAALWGDPAIVDRVFSPEECWALRRGRVHWVDDSKTGLLCKHLQSPPPDSYLCIPMMAQSEALGVLHLTHPVGAAMTDAKQRLAITMAEHIAMALSNLRLHETLRSQSIRDPLTGLFNRRFMEESLELELRRASRNQRPLGVIMIEVDLFHLISDDLGRDAGNSILRDVGELLQSTIRREDIACRISGQKFVVILPNAGAEITAQRAENLREMIKNFEMRHRRQPLGRVTASAGAAVFPDHGRIGEALLRAAEGALNRAKQDGGDRVCVAS